MDSYDHTNVYSKIFSLEDKVNRLEEIISYGNRDELNSYPYCNGGKPSYYKSAVRLSKVAREFKEDLVNNPRHKGLSRDNYQKIYTRVSILEKELNDIVQGMKFEYGTRSDCNYYSNTTSRCCYDTSPYFRECNIPCRYVRREPERKRVMYKKYVELVPSSTSSSDSVEEVIYYIESPTSSSSSSVIVEEYIPKHYTRRTVRNPPTFDVSKSKPRPSVEKSTPKSRTIIKRKSPPEISVSKQPKVRSSKKEKKKPRVEKSDTESDIPNDQSEIFLVKRSKESPKNKTITKPKQKNDKYFVSRLKKVDMSGDEGNYKNNDQKLESLEKKSEAVKKGLKFKKRTFNTKGSKRTREKPDNGSQTDPEKSITSDKRITKKIPWSSTRSKETHTVARGSFILSDPFVRTIYYDDVDSVKEEIKASNSNIKSNTVQCGMEQDLPGYKSKLSVKYVPQSKICNASVYEMSNSIYSFDPLLKQKEKLYPKEKRNGRNVSIYSNNSSARYKRIHHMDQKDIIVLNDNLNPQQKKFSFKKKQHEFRNINENVIGLDENYGMSGKNCLTSLEDSNINNNIQNLFPVGHSVYLTTVPVFPPSSQLPPNSLNNYTQTDSMEKISSSLQIPSQHRSDVEDEILMNVARKLSPIVAKIINNQYHKNKINYRTQSRPEIRHSNIENPSSNILYNGHNTQTDVVCSYSNQNLLWPVTEECLSNNQNKHLNSVSSENEIFIDVNNPLAVNRSLMKNVIYVSKLEDSSPLQRKSHSNIRKIALKKKIQSLTSITSLLKKHRRKKNLIREKQSENLLKHRESDTHRRNSHMVEKKQQVSQINGKQGSSISRKQPLGSKISRLHKVTKSQTRSNSEEEDKLKIPVPLQNSLSAEAPNNSTKIRSASLGRRKRSVSGMRSTLPSRGKQHKKNKEFALISILNKLRGSHKTTSGAKLEQVWEPPKVIHSREELEQEQANREVDKTSKSSPRRDLEPVLPKEAGKQSKCSPRYDFEQKPAEPSIKKIAIKVENRAYGNQETHLQSKLSPSQWFLEDNENEEDFVDKSQAGYDGRTKNKLSDKSETNMYGSREFLKQVQSVSRYYEDPIYFNDNKVESHMSQDRLNEPTGNLLGETMNSDRVAKEVDPLVIAFNQTKIEEGQLQNLSKTPRKMKELQFSIHFTKERRSKFESPSILSLDNFFSSQYKKVYSSEDLSLGNYVYDDNTESYKYRKILPKRSKRIFKFDEELSAFPVGTSSSGCYDKSVGFVVPKNNHFQGCCRPRSMAKSEQIISDGSYVDWHKVANEIKRAK